MLVLQAGASEQRLLPIIHRGARRILYNTGVELMTELPCPFCKSETVGLTTRHSNTNYHFVDCYDCEARGPESTDPDKAIDQWNEAKRDD